MRDSMSLPDTGLITGPRRSLFLSQTHFHIFGLFFPLAVPQINAAASLVVDLYRSLNLTGRVVAAPSRTGSDVTVVTGESRDRGDVLTSARHWPKVLEEEAETLRR